MDNFLKYVDNSQKSVDNFSNLSKFKNNSEYFV
nr:MAG TPA: hypothetical protein [Caudoviricetes sp.]